MEDEGILIGFAAQHHTINFLHKALCLCEAGDAAIDDNSELWEGFFDGKHPLIAQGGISRFSFGLNPDKTAIRA